VFGVLWWMYGGYVWLGNARTPSQTPERLLMLVGMAGFLIMALAIPEAFGRDGVALGLGYLIVVVVHGWLYRRVNKNIARVVPFNLFAAALVIVAGIVKGPAGYVLWAVALAAPVLSPLVIKPRGRFDIQPSHFTERHGALVIIVFGESVVDIGIGAEGHAVTVSLVLSAVLGLALAAALWPWRRGSSRPSCVPGAPCRPGRAWPWAAGSRCSWRAAPRSGTRSRSAPSGTGWARRRWPSRLGRLRIP
jgi:low temperature requirement protein LtrA